MIWVVCSCGLLMIAMLFGVAITTTQNRTLKSELTALHSRCAKTERKLSRLENAHAYDKELYDMDIRSMRNEVEYYEKEVARMEKVISDKNKEIIKLKAEQRKGGNK